MRRLKYANVVAVSWPFANGLSTKESQKLGILNCVVSDGFVFGSVLSIGAESYTMCCVTSFCLNKKAVQCISHILESMSFV